MLEQFENKSFTGYLSANPEMRFFESGKSKVSFSIPLKQGEITEWLNCESWNKLAENISEKYTKGSLITVFGNFRTETYKEKEITKFIVNNVI